VAEQESLGDAKRFGTFLRKLRERKRLSLDAVEEMSSSYSERLTKSHLSRIENGLAEPSVRKLFALSQIYGMPLTSLAERFELDLHHEQHKVDLEGKSHEQICEEVSGLRDAGRYLDALIMLTVALEDDVERESDGEQAHWLLRLRVGVCDCLNHLGRHEAAKVGAEELLSAPNLTTELRLQALECFVSCCYRLNRFTVAMMGLERAERELRSEDGFLRQKAEFAVLRGNICYVTGDFDGALGAYADALRLNEGLGAPFLMCTVRVNMASALIEKEQHQSAREQLDAALLVAESSGYDRLRALAMSNLALLAYRQGDPGSAETWAIRSNAIARSREFATLVFRNCFYLMKIARDAGDSPGVKANERTLRSLLGSIDDNLPEAREFREAVAGGA
jgi:transcriptional regulator with XRE-family HTH domain